MKKNENTTYAEELSGVGIAIINSDRPSADANIESYSEIGGLEWALGAVLPKDDLSIKEGSLRGSGVSNLGLSDHNRPILKEVEDDDLSYSHVLKS